MFLAKLTGLRYAGSFSWAALPMMAKILNEHPCQAWEQRHQKREIWKRELDAIREKDQCFLAREVLKTGDIAAGLRDKKEIDAVRAEKLFDHILWVDRLGTPVDPTVTYRPSDCDEVVWNDGSLEEYHNSLTYWAHLHGLA
jgi:hypothetical protein